jgi:surface antigen
MAIGRRTLRLGVALACAMALGQPLAAISLREPAPRYHWECVPFAREVSGIQIYGDAWTWWGQAEGRYKRGDTPRVGAVLAFQPHGGMRLGHVATVNEIIDRRTIKVTHANWSRIDGRRGQIERDVEIRDVSEAGDWSRVRVWYAPLGDLGTTAWPVHGFIYPSRVPAAGEARPVTMAKAEHGTSAKPPKLAYADVRTLQPRKTAQQSQPTGRLSYLGKLLPKLD